MAEDKKKALLLDAAAELIKASKEPDRVTSREIAAKAGVNAAMINYYYGSKENLVLKAVEKNIDAAGIIFKSPPDPKKTPKERLRKQLVEICEVIFKYRRYTKLYIPHLLLEGEINLPQYILPAIKEHFGAHADETACRLIAYQIVSFFQLVFYRSDEFSRYCGIDVCDRTNFYKMIDWELERFLPKGEN